MCGIAGAVGTAPEHAQRAMPAMLKAMAHRGPDDETTFADAQGGCWLGHRRLAIIDPDNGRQPMHNEDGRYSVIFNGCIYNYQDIQRELRGLGHRFKTNCDTEVIVHAYEQWGADCVRRFNGMWAFVVWDRRERTLFASRDRIGVKPFYYVHGPQGFWFASEIKSLLAGGAVPARPDADGLRQYLTFQYCLGQTTMFEGVHNLPPGHNLVLKPGQGPAITCFWDLTFNIDTEHGEEHFVDKLNWLLQDSVRLRLRSDVPLGTHLSGGLDSTTVVSLARMLLGDASLKTFSGAFADGPAYDETRYAKLASKAASTEYLEIYLGAKQFADSIEKIIWHMDQPAAGPGVFPQFFVSKLAAEHVKVVLGGQGGDEIFIGYARYLVAYLEECLKGAIEDTAHRGHYVATLETIVPSLPTLESYIPMLKGFWHQGLFDPPAQRYFALMDRFADSKALLGPAVQIDPARTFEEFRGEFEAPGAGAMINRILRFDLRNHLQSLLQVEDRTSMAWGLESRVPLLDYRLVELMASIPPVIKFRNGLLKHLFRKAVRNLVPPEIHGRTDKMGFPVPFADWARGELRGFVGDILLSKTARQRGLFDPKALEASLTGASPFSRGTWGALCLELWFRTFIDQTAN